MTVSALVSGGKDSLYAAFLAEMQGWTVDELVLLWPNDPDSLLFHTPNLSLVALQAKAWGKRLREVRIAGKGEEAEGRELTNVVRAAGPIVSAGAIASAYQWTRLLRIVDESKRRLYTPLWGKEPARVVRSEIDAGLDIRIVHVAAEGLGPELLGEQLDLRLLERLQNIGLPTRPVNVAGEGGEFETLVVDAPFWRARIKIDQAERTRTGGAYRLSILRAHLEQKRSWDQD